MATLEELGTLHARGTNESEDLVNRIKGAILIAAEGIRVEAPSVTNHAARLAWAKGAFIDPRRSADELWGAILGANGGFTIAQILAASDAAIQAAVNDAVEAFLVF